MQTRRELLQQAIFLPMAAGTRTTLGQRKTAIEVVPEPNCLSEESAEGFLRLIESRAGGGTRDTIVLCGVSRVSRRRTFELRERASGGASIVWETAPLHANAVAFEQQKQVLREAFGIGLRNPIAISSDGLYIEYSRPFPALTRTFSSMIPLDCDRAEVIARYDGAPVAMRRRIGRGCIVFLGSMLGPNLRAEEREATRIGARLLNFQE